MATEWFNTNSHGRIGVAFRGTELGEFSVTEEAALVFSGDEMSILEGPLATLISQTKRALQVLESQAAVDRDE